MRHRPRHRRAPRVGDRRDRHRPGAARGHRQPGHRHGRGGDRRLHGGGAERVRAATVLRRRPRRVRRARAVAVPLRRPAPVADAAQPAAACPGQRGHPGRHGPAGFRRDRDAAAVGAHAGGLARVLRPGPPAPRLVLRAPAEPAARQAAPHGGRLRPLLPDRPLPAGRGPPRRPPVRVQPARHGVLLRHPGRRHGLRLGGRPRRGRGGDGGAAAADRAHDVGRRPGPLRHRQARPALRHGADRPDATSSRGQRSRRSPPRRSRRSWCPRGPPTHARGSTSSPSRPRRPARSAWPGSASSTATRPRSTAPWPATCPSRRGRASWNGRRREPGTSSWPSRTSTRRPAPCSGRCATRSGRPPVGQGPHRYVWVVDFPMFEGVGADGNLQPAHHPFTMPYPEDLPLLASDPLAVRSQAYDLVLNGWELGSGSVRIHRGDIQSQVFAALGISPEDAEARFGFLLGAFRYGAPPHAGFAFGVDRLVAILAGRRTSARSSRTPRPSRAPTCSRAPPPRCRRRAWPSSASGSWCRRRRHRRPGAPGAPGARQRGRHTRNGLGA